ncbi:MAG: peptidase [Bacteroidetes bacterium]|nr:peptidase [Bacteroidota bacterium]MBT5528210.1 peptidase [Cytophagia bacterium]MBT5989610.1 peptidase [Bacteroidota bacterium]MBT6835791.1 peptidase [Bacteroidota bacterium]MBT7041413.1 peptidase [Bacteroidota bacterium]
MIRLKFLAVLFFLFMTQLYGDNLPVYSSFFSDEACRINFYLGGSHDSQFVEIVQVRKIKQWGGSKTILIDPLNYGNYRIRIYDLKTASLIFQKGFSTLFEEWQMTAIAKDTVQLFEESVLFPFPKFPVNVVIQVRNPDNSFTTLKEYNVIPEDGRIKQDELIIPYKYIIKNGDSHKKIDIVFLAEGYTKEQRSKFLKDVKFHAKKLLKTKPYKKYKNDFNVVALETWSNNTGTDFPQYFHIEDTHFDCGFNTFGSERYLMTNSYWKVVEAASVVPYDQIVILVNSDEYGGGGIYNHYASFTSDNKMSDFVLSHEFGHSFAGLADEYVGNHPYAEKMSLEVEPWHANVTTLQDFSSKWKDMVDSQTPIPTVANLFGKNVIGAYEGAAYLEKGVYRAQYNCSMRSVIRDQFCPVCSKAIVQMIKLNTF